MSLKIVFANGLPGQIIFDAVPVGDAWGVETADYDSFFTLTEKPVACKQIHDRFYEFDQRAIRQVEVEMQHGHWTLEIETRYFANTLMFTTQLQTVRPTCFQDFVHRFRFYREIFDEAQIARHIFRHRQTNRWYQYTTSQVRLSGAPFRADITVLSAQFPEQTFNQQMYVRDEPSGYWIVHSRLMPLLTKTVWIRWQTRRGRWLDVRGTIAARLLRFSALRRFLWYRAERVGGRPNLQAQALATLQPKDIIFMQTRIEFTRLQDR